MSNDNWIKCSDRLPDEPKIYKAKTDTGKRINIPYMPKLSGEMIWLVPDGVVIVEWQPNVNE